MLEKILKLYVMAMETGCTSPLPHLFGPPGTGKSTVVKQAADLLGVQMHTINLSRVSPLELEGVQMPHGTEEAMKLRLLHATFWTQLNEGDILLFDEFLRAFPEVMNGLLDIITARQVGGLQLPSVFFLAASNSVIAYDKALEDRLLHLPVPDPRKSKQEREHIGRLIVSALGLLPVMATSTEMDALISAEILPMYQLLDHLKKRSAPPILEGSSVRRLIGQAELREVQSSALRELIDVNNMLVKSDYKWQYLFLLDGKNVQPTYRQIAEDLLASGKVTPLQARNIRLNLQLAELEESRHPTDKE